MTYILSFNYRDNEGKIAKHGLKLSEGITLAQLDVAVNLLSARAAALSSASIIGAEFVQQYDYTDTPPASILSSSYDRLLILCRNGTTYGSVTIPSPAPRTYLPTGPFRGFKVAPSDLAEGTPIEQFVSLLSQTVLPSGEPFPTEEFIAALMVPQP